MGKYKHPCIKCRAPYESDELDAYYCPTCDAERKEIAKKLDAQFLARPKKEIVSDLKAFEANAKVYTAADGRQIYFERIRL